MPNNRFNLTQGIVMVPAEVLAQEPRQRPSQVKRMFDGRLRRARGYMKIHLMGPSGSGTSTLGRMIASKYQYAWFDSDNFYWHKTNPPFTKKREIKERMDLMQQTLQQHESWVLSGSMLKWGNRIKKEIDLVIYLYVDQNITIKRLETREREDYGNRIDPGNDMNKIYSDFIDYSKQYETGGMEIRSRLSENEWMKELSCKIIRIEEEMSLDDELILITNMIEKNHRTIAST